MPTIYKSFKEVGIVLIPFALLAQRRTEAQEERSKRLNDLNCVLRAAQSAAVVKMRFF
jgi:hypothetical protein